MHKETFDTGGSEKNILGTRVSGGGGRKEKLRKKRFPGKRWPLNKALEDERDFYRGRTDILGKERT
jgi:hypothetical protein